MHVLCAQNGFYSLDRSGSGAGVSLGLCSQIGNTIPHIGRKLECILVATIVLNQIVGPLMLERALRAAGEVGKEVLPH